MRAGTEFCLTIMTRESGRERAHGFFLYSIKFILLRYKTEFFWSLRLSQSAYENFH